MGKGQIHVEWVISFGIFLMYVLGMIIFIKPGYIPYYSNEELISLIEDGLKENYYWSVKKVPMVFVKGCSCNEDNSCSFSLSNKRGGRWSVNGSYIFTDNVASDTILWFSFYNSFYNKDFDKGFNIKDNSNLPNDPRIPSLCKKEDYVIGTVENVYGLNVNLKFVNYKDLKDILKYPEGKDFIISLNDIIIKDKEPGGNVNVYVKEWTDFYVDVNGERDEVKINLKVW